MKGIEGAGRPGGGRGRAALAAGLAAVLVLPGAASALAVGVQPLTVDLRVAPGQTATFSLVLTSAGQPERVKLRLYQPVQLRSGELDYRPADPQTYPPAGWVRLDPEEVELPATGGLTVQGRVSVPFGAGGTHPIVVMVEPQVAAGPGSVAVQLRYAVRVNVRVPGLAQRPRVEIQELVLGLHQGVPSARVAIHNPTALDFLVEAQATLRDQNRRLVARLTLASETGHRSGRNQTRLYPGATVDFFAPLPVRLDPGRYDLQVFVTYDETGRATARREVVLEAPLGAVRAGSAGEVLRAEPAQLALNARPGELLSAQVALSNGGASALEIYAFAREVAPGYSRSVWPYARVRSALPLKLEPGRSGRLALALQPPRDLPPGGLYGMLVLRAWPGGTDPRTAPPAAEAVVPVALVVGEPGPPMLALRGISYLPPGGGGSGATLEVQVENTGAIHVLPEARLRLETEAGQAAGEWNLQLSPPAPWLPPGEIATLSTAVPELAPGRYRAVVRVGDGKRVLVEEPLPLEVEP